MDAEQARNPEAESDLPAHEQDEEQRRRSEFLEPEPESDPVEETGLPEHERDPRGGEDTGTPVPNP